MRVTFTPLLIIRSDSAAATLTATAIDSQGAAENTPAFATLKC